MSLICELFYDAPKWQWQKQGSTAGQGQLQQGLHDPSGMTSNAPSTGGSTDSKGGNTNSKGDHKHRGALHPGSKRHPTQI
jgi:hypothetical protein